MKIDHETRNRENQLFFGILMNWLMGLDEEVFFFVLEKNDFESLFHWLVCLCEPKRREDVLFACFSSTESAVFKHF